MKIQRIPELIDVPLVYVGTFGGASYTPGVIRCDRIADVAVIPVKLVSKVGSDEMYVDLGFVEGHIE